MTTDANPTPTEPTTPTTPVTLDVPEVQAPAAPTVPAPAPVAINDAAPVEFEPTGDVGLDMALAFIGKQGISETHPAMVAATKGDFSILKAELAAKGAAGWEQFVALGETAYQRKAADAAATAAKTREAVIAAAGGEQEWLAVQKWASANATPEEKAQINGLLNQGGVAAKGAVQYLLSAYSRANNVVVDPRDATSGASRGGIPNADNGPLSPRAYADAVQQLNVKLRGRIEGSQEYATLQARRNAFRG
jgi:hypothetical protein